MLSRLGVANQSSGKTLFTCVVTYPGRQRLFSRARIEHARTLVIMAPGDHAGLRPTTAWRRNARETSGLQGRFNVL